MLTGLSNAGLRALPLAAAEGFDNSLQPPLKKDIFPPFIRTEEGYYHIYNFFKASLETAGLLVPSGQRVADATVGDPWWRRCLFSAKCFAIKIRLSRFA